VRATPATLVLVLAVAAGGGACGGGGDDGGGGDTPGVGGGTITGTVTYDRVPAGDDGLVYSATQRRPVRGAVVQLYDFVNAQSPTPVGTATTTDESGRYTLQVPQTVPASVAVVVLAQTQSPPMVVKDNTSNGAQYGLSSAAFAPAAGTTTKDLHAASGWSGTSYGAARNAGPFAILDSMYTAARAFVAARPSVAFAPLALNWSPRNVPQSGDKAAGRIGTSHWDGQELYILGLADADTDEYDDHVIVHEWGHYFESTLSRSDSPGGTHSTGDRKDPRLAFGEGWGNALSAIALAPDAVYRDTSGPQQSRTGIIDDVEGSGLDPAPGWFSERSVSKILYDVFDAANEPHDQVALGLGPIYDVMVGGQKATPALTTIFSFLTALKAAQPGSAAAIDALAAERQVHVFDEWGAGETNIPPTATNPIYLRLGTDVPFPYSNPTLGFAGADADGTIPFNDLAQNWYFRLVGDGQQHRVTTTSAEDVDVFVYRAGALLNAGSAGRTTSGNENVPFATQAGQTYVIVVTGFGTTAQYTANLTIQ
jgi:hypothetical protein